MAARQILLSTAFCVSIAVPVSSFVRAEDARSEEVAKRQWEGEINGSGVHVRSAAREDAYPTMRLEKGTKVKIVGMQNNWLKIEPPEGSFAYVPKVYVQRRADGTVGR